VELATCDICPRRCKLTDGAYGFCDVRAAHYGSVRDKYYATIAWPGIQIRRRNEETPWGFAAMRNKRVAEVYLPGCNLKCKFCIAPFLIDLEKIRGIQRIEATDLVRKTANSTDVIGFAGGEASIHTEYVTDVFSRCLDRGIQTYIETNGYMTRSTAEKLSKYTNYAVIGLKASLDQAYYQGNLGVMETRPIHDAISVFMKNGCEVMLTNLTDPSLWDDTQALVSLTKWIAEELGPETPLVLGSLERGEIPLPWTDERIHVTPWQRRRAYLEDHRKIAMKSGLKQVFCIFRSPRVGRRPPIPEPIAIGYD
jgi:pyruvate formate lyase activating enzyme